MTPAARRVAKPGEYAEPGNLDALSHATDRQDTRQ